MRLLKSTKKHVDNFFKEIRQFMLNGPDLWEQALVKLSHKVSKPSYEMWLSNTTGVSLENSHLVVSTPNPLAHDWLNKHYMGFVLSVLEDITGTRISVSFITKEAPIGIVSSRSTPTIDNTEDDFPNNLNPKYTFDSFVIGAANRFAHAAALAVAEQPAQAYNPLFIYGGVGLGKTHLMHAIGNYVQEKNPLTRVVYISSEKFTNEFINAILGNNSADFRSKYRLADILLIDDIQFLAKKEQTQEEFFHTFNALHESDKQIVISSDRPPKEIPTLEERLRSRFEWGLITDIQPPDLETRIAILRKKIIADNIDVSYDVLNYIGSTISSNIRELEGALIRVVAYSALVNRALTRDLAEEALREVIAQSGSKFLTIQNIQQEVCSFYRLSIDDLLSKKRTKTIALARQIAIYLARELTASSLLKIGEEFGGRDHSTILHSHSKIKEALSTDTLLLEAVSELKTKIIRNYTQATSY